MDYGEKVRKLLPEGAEKTMKLPRPVVALLGPPLRKGTGKICKIHGGII